MRDFRFRAWHEAEKEMIPNCNQGWEGDVFNWLNEGQPITIMQYTGLKDKNGKEIYEGDIVYLAGLGDVEIDYPYLDLFQAEIDGDIGEIKGNIYENPELMVM